MAGVRKFKQNVLLQKMHELKIYEKDIIEIQKTSY